MHKDHVERTAMSTQYGSYEWLVMPMGLTNSPSQWQRHMQAVFGHLPFVRVFVDDFMIFSKTPEEHVEHVRQTLEVCRQNNIYLKKSKLHFCKQEIRFLGHVVSKHGRRPQHDKVAAVRDWPVLQNRQDVHRFMGLAQFYR